MHFYRAWKLFIFIEFSSKAFREHFVDSEVSEEAIILLENSAFVFELLEVPLELVKANHLSDAGYIHAC